MADMTIESQLSRREREVLHLLTEQWTDIEIADELVLSPHTVRRHVASIRRKLGVTSRREAVRLYLHENAKWPAVRDGTAPTGE